MAINFYGSCGGSSAEKYDLWLNVKQNSQSIEENKSNVTVKLLLKRNDGYAASAYNLNEGSNSVTLKVGGSTRVSGGVAIDTRNGATVTLAQWSGDVAHNEDGTLRLALSGSFTMSGTSLTGGSASGSLDCTAIPRASSLVLSATSVNPEDTVGADITAASGSFSHKLKWAFGSKSVTHSLSAGVLKDAFTVPLSWADELTNASSGDVSVTLTTYKDSKKIGSSSYSLRLKIPKTEEFLPQFNLVVAHIPAVEGLDEFVKGRSQVELSLEGLTLRHGASLASVTARVDSATKASLPARFDLTKSGEVTLKLTVKDSRGLSVTRQEKITVCDYSAPSIRIKSLLRCDENGSPNTRGTYVRAELESAFSSLNGKNTPEITYKYKAPAGAYSGELPVEGSPCILGDGNFLNSSSYTLAFKITDAITRQAEPIERSIPSTEIPFNIGRGGKRAAFGCYAENENELTVAWRLNPAGGLAYENAAIELKSTIAEKRGSARYFPCIEALFLRLRLEAASGLEANKNHTLATFTDHPPSLLTPVTVNVNTGVGHRCCGYIKSDSGELVINSDTPIAKGDYIYVSGICLVLR